VRSALRLAAAAAAAGAFGLFGVAVRAQSPGALRTERVATVHLDDVWPREKPDEAVELYLRALTGGRAPVRDLTAKDFLVREDERRIASDELAVNLLQDAKRGVACVLVLDRSPTMRQPFLEMKQAAQSFVEGVGDYDRIAVVGFAGGVDEVADFSSAPSDVKHAIDALEPSEEPAPTRLYDALHRAIELIRAGAADLPRRSIMIVFSDGQDGGSDHTLEQVVELAKGGLGDPRVLVYGIGYDTGFGGGGLSNLAQLAEGTTADFWRVDPGIPLSDFYGRIWKQMLESYVLSFETDLDGESHPIEVVVDGEARGERTARYPEVGSGLRPWLLGALGILAAAGAAWLVVLARRAGCLEFQNGPERGRRVRLRHGLNRLGQGPDNDILIEHDTVSRRHAEIDVVGRSARIRDLDSTNGTFVNDLPIATGEDRALEADDRIRIADVDLVYLR